MRLIVFSNSSFASSHVRVGVQIMAFLLAERGHSVDYVAVPTHPLDLLSPTRSKNCRQAWLKGRDRKPMMVTEHLREFFLRVPFSRSRKFWRFESQIPLYTMFAPSWTRDIQYDVCIRDTAMSGLFARKIHSKAHVLRLNDNPEGLTNYIHPMVVEQLNNQIRNDCFDEIWPTTEAMTARVKAVNSSIPTARLPNGVFLEHYAATRAGPRKPRSAVYLGTFNDWVDIDLLRQAAQELSDWHIDLFGPSAQKLRRLSGDRNITYRGPVPFERVPEVLSRYRVGLIPFSGHEELLNTVDPLKANEYLAAGLGIASTSHGNLETGLKDFACFGNEPSSFAAAVRAADRDCEIGHDRKPVKKHLVNVSWPSIMDKVEQRLMRLASLSQH